MIKSFLLICLTSVLLWPMRGYSQSYDSFTGKLKYRIEEFTENDGVPFDLSLLYQDKRGYVWIGTGSGLIQYDGYEFNQIDLGLRPEEKVLSTIRITALTEDSQGNIWIGTDQLFKYDPNSRLVTRYDELTFSPPDRPYTAITGIVEEGNGVMWISTGMQLARLTPEDEKSFDTIQFAKYQPRRYSDRLLQYLNQTQSKSISSILNVGKDQHIQQDFEIYKDGTFLILAQGEATPLLVDFGWLEDANGEVVYSMSEELNKYAGGSPRNVMVFDQIVLKPGQYRLHYITNKDHDAGEWVDRPPAFPHYQGIQVFRPSEREISDIEEILNDSSELVYPGLFIRKLFRSSNGLIYAVTDDNLFRISSQLSADLSEMVAHFDNLPLMQNGNTLPYTLDYMIEGTGGRDWVSGKTWHSNEGGKVFLALFDPKSGHFDDYSETIGDLQNFRVTGLNLQDFPIQYDSDRDYLWVGANRGMNGLYRIENPFQNSPDQSKLRTELDFRWNARSILLDHSKKLWIAGSGSLVKLHIDQNYLREFELPIRDGTSRSAFFVSLADAGKNGVFFGTINHGFFEFNSSYGSFMRLQTPDYKNSYDPGITLADELGNIWISGFAGIHQYDPTLRAFTTFRVNGDDLINPGSVIHPTALARDGLIWCHANSPRGGVLLFPFDPRHRKFILTDSILHIRSPNMLRVQVDKDNKFYVFSRGQNGGLMKFDLDSALSGSVQAEILSKEFIMDFDIADHGGIWAGTRTSGLVLMDSDANILKRIMTVDGLLDNRMVRLNKDSKGNIWLFGSKGYQVFNPRTNAFISYSALHNLHPGIDLIQGGRFQDSGGNFHLSYPNIGKHYIFHPDSIRLNQIAPRLDIKQILVSDSLVHSFSSLHHSQVLDFRSAENHISIEYIGLHYDNPDEIKYAYTLEDWDQAWVYAGYEKVARYPKLSPGDYTFKVKAANADGVWSDPLSLRFTIHPPWYWNLWSKIIYALSTIAAMAMFVRWRTTEQRKKLEKAHQLNYQLQQIDKLKDQFLANTSHELRTPLNGIIGIAESMIDGATGKLPKKSIWNLSLITSSGKRLANLINDILDFSKLRNKQLVLKKTPVDIRSAVDVVLNLSKPLVLQKEVELINEVPEDLELAEADENRLQQILHNLVGNGVKFTETGEVKISAERQNGHIKIDVSDTGIGIREEDHEKIFHAFEQTDGSMAREYGGTGLGLSVTKQLVELHGGTIDVQSKVGEGSVFSFTLPTSKVGRQDFDPAVSDAKVGVVEDGSQQSNPDIVAKQKSSGGSSWSEVSSGQSALSRRQDSVGQREGLAGVDSVRENGKRSYRILIVDDEPVNLQVLENHLSLHNYSVTQASSGPKALEILQKDPDYHLIILDIMMPKMSGYEVCEKLREMYPSSELPVVMLTAKNRVTDLMEGFSSGANDYLTKPFSKDELLTRIRTHLELSHINKSYGRFVPHDFLELLGKESIIDIRLGDQIQGEMTVLFSDIRSYTTLSEQMTPEENFAFINAYLKRIGPVIQEHRGFISHYFGDGLMALFNGSSQDAIQAAVEIQQRVQKYNSERIAKGKIPIEAGIGIHSGDLMVGIIGDEDRNDASVISDAVNTASRLEGLTSWFGVKIIVSESCLNGDQGSSRFLGKVKVKGKEKTVSIYEWFGGDPGHQRRLKADAKADFALGLSSYYEREFVEAAGIFKNILKKNPDDRPAKFYLEKSAKLILEEVPEDWSGVIVMEGK